MSAPAGFCVFILSYKRPGNVSTMALLERSGYTGPVYVVVADDDPTLEQYRDEFGDRVLTFSKAATAATFDQGDNFGGYNASVYPRNAFDRIAAELGYEFFIQLDDDYNDFRYKFTDRFHFVDRAAIRDLDAVLTSMVEFMRSAPRIDVLAMAQGGDFLGGSAGPYAKRVFMLRKVMNSFVCRTGNPIVFPGRLNEDVNLYVQEGPRGRLFFTLNQVALQQVQTQRLAGGMQDAYLAAGTYVKSMYSVMRCPSAVKVVMMGTVHRRIHHQVTYNQCAPKIVAEAHRLARAS